MTLRVGSLFSGIGGIDLGLERAGMTVVFQVEIDAYCTRVLAKHWPDVPRFGDIRDVDPALLPACDILAGGFPCQDISNAGQRAGIDGTRSGLWTEYVRLIRALRPRYVLVENVAALLNRGMGRVLGDLAAGGYDAEWECLPASAFGAPHRRNRVWIVAYPQRQRTQLWPVAPERPGRLAGGGATNVADAERYGRQQGPQVFCGRESLPALCRETDRRWWAVEPAVGRVAHGIPRRVDRLRGLGNAVVPQVVEYIGLLIAAHANDLAVPA